MKIKELIEYLSGLNENDEVRLEDEDGQNFEATMVLEYKDFKNGETFIVIK